MQTKLTAGNWRWKISVTYSVDQFLNLVKLALAAASPNSRAKMVKKAAGGFGPAIPKRSSNGSEPSVNLGLNWDYQRAERGVKLMVSDAGSM